MTPLRRFFLHLLSCDTCTKNGGDRSPGKGDTGISKNSVRNSNPFPLFYKCVFVFACFPIEEMFNCILEISSITLSLTDCLLRALLQFCKLNYSN